MKPSRRALLIAVAGTCVAAGASARTIDADLRAAAERNDLAAFEALLRQGADVNARDAQQDSAFLLAARNGHAAIVRAALAAGADLRALNRYGSTALMGPAYRGHVETVRVLLATDIDIHHVNNLGWTAVLEAIALGTDGPAHRDIVRMLIARGSDVNARDREGASALQLAERKGQAEVARMLRGAGAVTPSASGPRPPAGSAP
jgi:ankyrin repeat protein